MPCSVIVGGFFGDEGKGKMIAYLSLKDNPLIAVRGGVGANAGHTFTYNDEIFKVRMLPSALLNHNTRLLIGAGVLVSPSVLMNEIEKYNTDDRTFIDNHCGIIEDKHVKSDVGSHHLRVGVGTTGTGTGPANADRAMRTLKLANEISHLKKFVVDVSSIVNDAIDHNKMVLAEGTQGTYLSLYHGTYPYVTSKDVTASGICSDIGVGPKKIDQVIIVFKSFVTRVGEGPLEDELSPSEASKRGWTEYGSVTGRQRRSSPFSFELAKKAVRLNSATQIALTKLDVLYPKSAGITEYVKLPKEAQDFIKNIEDNVGIRVTLIGTGANIGDIIDRRHQKL